MSRIFFFFARSFFLIRKTGSLVFGTVWGNAALRLWGGKVNGLVRCFGTPHLELSHPGSLKIGRGCTLRSSFISNPAGIAHPMLLATRGNGTIRIGDDCGFSGSVIVSESSVEIGDRVLVGAGCVIADTDFHPVDAAQRRIPHTSGACRPVVIGDDVFLGMHCLVLKGSRIGTGSVIGAGSVVTGNIPPMVIAAGNPARVVRSLEK